MCILYTTKNGIFSRYNFFSIISNKSLPNYLLSGNFTQLVISPNNDIFEKLSNKFNLKVTQFEELGNLQSLKVYKK